MPIALVFFVQYAYPILFLWVLLEQLGIPIPSIPVLLTAGTLSATHRISGTYSLAVVVIACMIADSIWFFLGRKYGGNVIRFLCRLSFETTTCVTRTEGYFSRRGPATLLFCKFVPGLATVAPPIAGENGMSYRNFLLYDTAGSILWAEAYLLGGRFFGDVAQKLAPPFFAWLGHFALIIFALMVLAFVGNRIYLQRKFLSQVRSMRLDPAELKQMLDDAKKHNTTPPFIVDLRHPLDYLPDPRVLPCAIRIGPNELTTHNEIIPRDRDVILYCTCPSEETSAKVAMQLHKLGVYRVRPLRGGFDGWKEAGYPLYDYVQDVPTSPEALKLQPTAQQEPADPIAS
jgi:membrane protein DedA with SNARE-associated domain/rhodanese-related sulfurtransferase